MRVRNNLYNLNHVSLNLANRFCFNENFMRVKVGFKYYLVNIFRDCEGFNLIVYNSSKHANYNKLNTSDLTKLGGFTFDNPEVLLNRKLIESIMIISSNNVNSAINYLNQINLK